MLNRTIPVIHDTYVDMDFGTGALKITPGHDPNDFIIGQRHGLQIINVLNKDATMNANAGPYDGLDRFECRQKMWADMEAAGLTIEVKPHQMQVPRSQRGGEVIEPLVSTQWFVKMRHIADRGLKAVADGDIRIVPDRFTKVYNHWLENIRDWCISRQLWWGHRIPVWYCGDCNEMIVARDDPDTCPKCEGQNLEQDPDVLDTWFSSGLWPFSTLGWPDDTPDLRRYYPTDVMETGYDILFFWVARMIMQGLQFTDQAPFHTIYLHGLVRDEHGRKMSKTLGNVVDPLEVMDEYGTDALRFTLLTGSTPGNDMNLSLERVASNRNFSNKIWNATRFVLGNLDAGFVATQAPPQSALSLPGRWILSRLNAVIAETTRLIDEYNFGEAGRQTYDFFWGEYADWYIEIAKIALNGQDPAARKTTQQVLVYVLDQTLRLLHPYIPFITEAAWQHLPHQGDSLSLATWPQAGPRDEAADADMGLLISMVRAIRNARAENDVEPGRKITALIAAANKHKLVAQNQAALAQLARLDADSLQVVEALAEKPDDALTLVIEGGLEIVLPLSGLIDVAAERERLQKEAAELEKRIAGSRKTLANENFASKAPAAVVEREQAKLADLESQAEKIQARLATLN
jgi:valyl-tRNA synthetase